MSDIKYHQLRDALLQVLESGNFKPGDRFYSEKELAERYKLSCGTVVRALNEMAADGYFERRRRQGTFVAGRPAANRALPPPIYVNILRMLDAKHRNRSTFVFDEIQRGVINSYPGPVRLESFKVLTEMRRSGEKFPAIILDCGDYDPDTSEYFANDVLINVQLDGRRGMNRIAYEPFSGIFAAISHLFFGCGRRRIGFLGGDSPCYFAERFFAYRVALEALGVSYDEAIVRRGLPSGAVNEARELLTCRNRPDAIFADSDSKGRDVIDIAIELGLRVPDDVAVIEFDDAPGADQYTIPLTSVRVPYYHMGELAVKMLEERTNTGRDAESITVGCNLMIRESTQKGGGKK